MRRALWCPWGGGLFLMSEVPLYRSLKLSMSVQVQHLIADHLSYFDHLEGNNVEDYAKLNGFTVDNRSEIAQYPKST